MSRILMAVMRRRIGRTDFIVAEAESSMIA
jgi:hypothetical protein